LGIRESGVEKNNSNPASALDPTIPHSPFSIPGSTSIPNSPFPILVLEGRAHEAMIAADAVLLASGTAALEAMLAKQPMVVAYRLSPLTYRIVKGLGLLKVDRYSLPNHLAGRELVPELMQDACTPDALAAALREPLRTRRIDPALLAEYQRLHAQLGGDADRNAAAAILNKPV
jgi:lipid-A-disaccharide synthase